ncbi:hypothetical protein ACF0H5_013009 [Mactra antiquata]
MGLFSVLKMYQTQLVNNRNNSLDIPDTDMERRDEVDDVTIADDSHNKFVLILSVTAIAVFLIIIVFAVLLVRIHRRRKKMRRIATKYERMLTTVNRPAPFSVVGTRRQLSDPEPKPSYNSFDETVSNVRVGDLELAHYRENKQRLSCDNSLIKHHSFDIVDTKYTNNKGLRRSKSVAGRLSQEDMEQNIVVAFTLKYIQKSRQLQLKLVHVSDLPVKTYGFDIYTIVYLFPRNTDGVHSKSSKGGRDVVLNETFLFDDLMLPEVDKSTFRFVLYYKKKTRAGKDGFLGEMYMECNDIDWNKDQPIRFDCVLDKNKVKNGTRDKYLLEDLGSLFVCLEYQSTANRMKVMVRKASNLPKSDKLIGRPVHYVKITLMRNKEVVKSQETKSLSGYSPIWNQPFLFDFSGNDVNEYSIEFVIMRGKLHTKDNVVGHVTIGENGCRSGKQHWKEIVSPRPSETSKWHSIAPVLS